MLIDDYQKKAHSTATTKDIDVYALGLIGEAGSVASAIKKFKRDSPSLQEVKRDIQEQLGDVLWYLSEIATQYDLSLEDIARANLQKTEYLFKKQSVDFDDGMPIDQRLPRQLKIRFDDDKTRLQLFAGETPIGAPLTDNSYEDDGYRYHDAFHLAYMVKLGWSPVFRALLKCKRRKKPEVDEVEDGARARALEEGISVLVFSQSPPPKTGASLFADRAQVPFWLLESIKKMTGSVEVRAKTVGEWQDAITEGYQIFDKLRLHKGGTVVCDLDAGTLTFELPS